MDECEMRSAECNNDAACINKLGTYSCNCSLGYVGDHCDTANCSLGQCISGGTCLIDDSDRWSCECPKFYTGVYSVNIVLLQYCCAYTSISVIDLR